VSLSSSASVRQRLVLSLLTVLVLALVAHAQTDPALETGLKPFGSFHGGDIDSVNTTNGKLELQIPLISFPQRGGRLHVNYYIIYSSPSIKAICFQGDCTYSQVGGASVGVTSDAFTPFMAATPVVNAQHQTIGYAWTATDPLGPVHMMGALPVSSGPTRYLRALDASGWFADISDWNSPILYDATGLVYSGCNGTCGNGTIQDTNHNSITNNYGAIVDMIGRSIPALPTPTQGGSSTWTVHGYGGAQITFKFWYNSNRQLTEIDLPNGTSYKFQYESWQIDESDTGYELNEIDLPTGGKVTYQHADGPVACSGTYTYRALSTRTADASDGSGGHRWTYT